MRHGRVHARLCADSEVVDHAVLRGELLGVYRREEIPDVHEALVYGDLTVAGVPAVVVVLPGTLPLVGACAAALPVPNPRKFVHRRGLAPVQLGEEALLDGAAPALAAVGGDAQGRGQQVFLGVDDVHQPPQALRGVLAEADVDVDAAGTVGLCARRPDGFDDLLHHLDVFVAAHRADHLRRRVGDRAVALDRPVPPAASRKRGAAPALPPRVHRVPA